MFPLHTISWTLGREDPGEARDRAHRIALHEARIATDVRPSVASFTREAAPVRRAVPAGAGSTLDASACA
jgi:hypothetical protein